MQPTDLFKPSRGAVPLNVATTAHVLVTGGSGLLCCTTCGAEFRPQAGTNFAWPACVGATATCGPVTAQEYKALSVQQPWAGMLQRGEKTLEIRTWGVKYRGDLLLVTGLKAALLDWLPADCPAHRAPRLPVGVAMCLVELYDCRPMRPEDAAAAGCPYEPGLVAWCLRNVRPVQPVKVTGKQGVMKVVVALHPLTLP